MAKLRRSCSPVLRQPDAPAAHDAYFNNFTIIWQTILGGGRYDEAEELWDRALQPALQWEQTHQGQRIHKGTPYYFWAMTALLRGDTDHGYLLIHQAVDEDILTSRHQTPDTPGYALVILNYKRVDQAFRQWVLDHAAFLDNLITNYKATHDRALSLDEVKRRFLDTPATRETVFLLTYTLARLRKLTTLPDYTTKNPFAGQLQLNVLFEITRVIEAAIKDKNRTKRRFHDHAEYLLAAAGAPLTNHQLGHINGQFNRDFEATLQTALNGTTTVPPNIVLSRLQCDVALGRYEAPIGHLPGDPEMGQETARVCAQTPLDRPL